MAASPVPMPRLKKGATMSGFTVAPHSATESPSRSGDADEADQGGSDWVEAIKTTDMAELGPLMASLGGSSGRNANASNRNPLPRGRACESADWLVDVFKYLPPTNQSCGVPSVRVPITLTLRHSKPHTWYLSPATGGVVEETAEPKEKEKNVADLGERALKYIISRFKNASAEQAKKVMLEDQVDIVALYASKVPISGGRARTKIEYFDEGLLEDFLRHRPIKRDGVLQLFAVPTCQKAVLVRARHAGGRLASVEIRTNCNNITDTKTVIDRAVTFDGDEHLSRAGEVPKTSALFVSIGKLMRELICHINEHMGDTCATPNPTSSPS